MAEALQDRYTLERELGRGGMATVYLAIDLKHHRPVALKVLRPELAQGLGPERFRREIELAARLQHPHILSVHDSGEAGGQFWFTMPFVEGESLRDRLNRQKQLPIDEAVQIAKEAAQALEYAHQHGVIHRDIKPENILLTPDDSTLVADFGIARSLADRDERLTSTGLAVGTPAYMSPEQASGERDLGPPTDVYSLGCMLYEMLAGEPPFTGRTPQAILARRLSGELPPLRTLRPTVSPRLERAVTRALARSPADRFSSAADFLRALADPGGNSGLDTMAAASEPTSGGRARRGMAVVVAALGIGVLLGLGALFAWWQGRSPGQQTGDGKILAVLPFENLGDSADAYFAEGVANDVRTKLTQLEGLQVIARASSNQYRRTAKTQRQIARELGADYLLTATVQWEKVAGGTSRVRVTPELVEVRPGHAPHTRWGQHFDASMTDVFRVQADIAGQVAQALNVALVDSVKRELATRPTHSLPAYDAFLRGEATWQGMLSPDPPSIRQAITAYEQAVAIDPTFVRAWSQLSRAHSMLNIHSVPTPARAEAARRAAERALSLAPQKPEGHHALADYFESIGNISRALTESSTALALAPGDAELLAATAQDESNLGNWEAARTHLEQAVRLDPRSAGAIRGLGDILLYTRHYPEAAQAYDRALQLAPASLGLRLFRAMVALAQGDLPGAQAVLRAAPKTVDPTTLAAYVATYWDLYWVLDDGQQQLVLRLTPSAFDDDRGTWGIVLAQTYWLRGDKVQARVYADSARQAFEQQLQVTPEDAQLHAFLGLALAYLGQKAAAIREGERAVTLLPITRAPGGGTYIQHLLARIYLLVGEPEKALAQLEPLLMMPYFLSPGWLSIDPAFLPLRGNPRFEKLVKGP